MPVFALAGPTLWWVPVPQLSTTYRTLDVFRTLLDFIDDRNEEGASFSGAILGSSDETSPSSDQWNAFFLDGGRSCVPCLSKCKNELFFELEFCEICVLECFDILNVIVATLVCSLSPDIISFSFYLSRSSSLSIIMVFDYTNVTQQQTSSISVNIKMRELAPQ